MIAFGLAGLAVVVAGAGVAVGPSGWLVGFLGLAGCLAGAAFLGRRAWEQNQILRQALAETEVEVYADAEGQMLRLPQSGLIVQADPQLFVYPEAWLLEGDDEDEDDEDDPDDLVVFAGWGQLALSWGCSSWGLLGLILLVPFARELRFWAVVLAGVLGLALVWSERKAECLWVSRKGLRVNNQWADWPEIRGVHAFLGFLFVRTAGAGWYQSAVHSVFLGFRAGAVRQEIVRIWSKDKSYRFT